MSKLSIIEALQTTIKAIKSWMPFSRGENIQIYSDKSVNLGQETITGALGYRIIGMSPNKIITDDKEDVFVTEGGTYTLLLEEGKTIDPNYIGKEYTLYIKSTAERVGKITKIEGNVVTVDTFFHPNKWNEQSDSNKAYYYDNSYFFCDVLPSSGYVKIGDGAYAEGYSNRSMNIGTHSEGLDNISLGKYGHSEGVQTYAGYAAHAQNKLTKASGRHSHAQNYNTTASGIDSSASGRDTIASGNQTDAGGHLTKASGVRAFARGYGGEAKHQDSVVLNRNNITSHQDQTVVGAFNDPSKISKPAHLVIGNGENETSRSNAFVVYHDGTAEVQKQGISENSILLKKTFDNTIQHFFIEEDNTDSWVGGDNWYTIAETPSSVNNVSAMFKIFARSQPKGGAWTTIHLICSSCFSETPNITILNTQQKNSGTPLIDSVRIVTPKNYASNKAYLQVHITKAFPGVKQNGEIIKAGNGAEILVEASEREVNGGPDWEKQWVVTIDTNPFILNEATHSVTEKNLSESSLSNLDMTRVLQTEADGSAEVTMPNSPIDANIANVGFVNSSTKNIDTRLSILTEDLLEHEVRLDNIEHHLAPKYVMTDNTTAYTKDVPENACSKAQLNSIGGMTCVDEATNTFVDAKVTALKLRGANILGGTALSSAILSNVEGSKSHEEGKRISFKCDKAKGFRYDDFKPKTEYTFIFYGYNSDSTQRYSNLTLKYTDGKAITTVLGNSSFLFETAGTASYAIAYSDPSKSVGYIAGSYETGTTYLYPDKCGIFEGHITLDQFKEYEEKTIFEIPAEIQALPNYGKMFTELDLVNKKYYDYYCEANDIGGFEFEAVPSSDGTYTVYTCRFSGNMISDYHKIGAVLTEKPCTVLNIDGLSVTLQTSTSKDLSNITDDNELFYELFGDITLVARSTNPYWLGREVEHDISPYIDNNIIEVIEKGRIEFVNEYKQPVPSSISYMMGGHLLEKEA